MDGTFGPVKMESEDNCEEQLAESAMDNTESYVEEGLRKGALVICDVPPVGYQDFTDDEYEATYGGVRQDEEFVEDQEFVEEDRLRKENQSLITLKYKPQVMK